ncbi:neuropeptide ff receptor 2 [Plakobranchus ocellatus]|uniref:Neuropeptide ff receptor 2 n=1 Tax=Plakobranchus ocellatus TaxID=259542 RepID=A0AAV4B154_9GAST|nr:neuropeptide ff receptor 2 [Plakobranchus ocellatus]
MRTTTNTLIANLAVSDLMVACFCMWVHAGNQVTHNWPFGNFFCKINTFFQVLSVTASVLTLMIIAVERFYAVVFPFKRHWSSLATGAVIAAAWIVSLATAAPQLIVRKELKHEWQDRTDRWCAEVWPEYYIDTECNTESPGKITYYILVGVVMYFLPILVMIFTYSIIALRLLSRRNPSRRPSGGKMSSQDRAKKKVTKMLVMVLLVFIVSWSPHQVILLNDNLNPHSKYPEYMDTVMYVALFMAYSCSAINPILYAGFNENFRRGFVEAFRCILMQHKNRIDPDGSTMRSRIPLRPINANTEGITVANTIENRDLKEVKNGLAVPDLTAVETIEISDLPQDANGYNNIGCPQESLNSSAPSTLINRDSEYKSTSDAMFTALPQETPQAPDISNPSLIITDAVVDLEELPSSGVIPLDSEPKLNERKGSQDKFINRSAIVSKGLKLPAEEVGYSVEPLIHDVNSNESDSENTDISEGNSRPLLASSTDNDSIMYRL